MPDNRRGFLRKFGLGALAAGVMGAAKPKGEEFTPPITQEAMPSAPVEASGTLTVQEPAEATHARLGVMYDSMLRRQAQWGYDGKPLYSGVIQWPPSSGCMSRGVLTSCTVASLESMGEYFKIRLGRGD